MVCLVLSARSPSFFVLLEQRFDFAVIGFKQGVGMDADSLELAGVDGLLLPRAMVSNSGCVVPWSVPDFIDTGLAANSVSVQNPSSHSNGVK